MTLKEQFIDAFKSGKRFDIQNAEAISDKFAIGFLNWVLSPKTSELIHRLDIAGEIDEDITPEQLLKIFKKEQRF